MNITLVGIGSYTKEHHSHIHSEWEIILNIEGDGTMIIGSQEYPFSPGTIVCCPSNITHSKIANQHFRDIFIRVNDLPDANAKNVLVFSDNQEKTIENLMLMILRITNRMEHNYRYITNLMFEAMYQIILNMNSKSINKEVEMYINELVLNFSNPEYQIADAAKKTTLSDNHFRRLFKDATGATPTAYLADLRINYAKRLMNQKSDHKMSISEIAFLSGFYDQHYFSRVFKSKVGVSPREFYNSCLNKLGTSAMRF